MRKRRVRSRIRVWFSKRSNRRRMVICARVVGVCAAIVLLLWGVSYLPFFTIRSISVSERSAADQGLRDAILVYAESLLDERVYGLRGNTRYFFQRDVFEQRLREQFLQADVVVVEPGFWGSWEVTVEQRNVFGTFCTDEQCLLIDPTGFAFMEASMRVGVDVRISDSLSLGEYIFDADADTFATIPAVVSFLEENNLPVAYISLQSDTRVVHVHLVNSIGVWFDSSEALYDTTRALHIVFQEIFSDLAAQANIVSVDVRDPLSIVYERR